MILDNPSDVVDTQDTNDGADAPDDLELLAQELVDDPENNSTKSDDNTDTDSNTDSGDDGSGATDDNKDGDSDANNDTPPADDDDKVEGDGDKEGADDTKNQPDASKEDKSGKAFAEMRIKNKVYQNVINKAAAQAGMTPEAYLKKMQDDADAAEAKRQNIPVEVFQKMQQQDLELQQMRQQFGQAMFQQKFGAFQQKVGISDDEAREFAKRCIDSKIDMDATGVDLEVLYKGICSDIILEKERQQWIKQDSSNRNKSSKPTTGQGDKPKPEGSTIESMDDFENLLAKTKL